MFESVDVPNFPGITWDMWRVGTLSATFNSLNDSIASSLKALCEEVVSKAATPQWGDRPRGGGVPGKP